MLTIGPGSLPDTVKDTGVAAHITGASPGGARYRSDLTARQRCSAANGLWLCQTHGKEVDNDPATYTEDVLRAWQQDAMRLAAEEYGTARLASAIRAQLRGVVIPKASYVAGSVRTEDRLAVLITNTGTEVIDHFYLEVEVSKGLIENPHSYALVYRPARSTTASDFFLIDPAGRMKLYPGAETEVCSFMIDSEESGPNGLLARIVFCPAGGAPTKTEVKRDVKPS